MKIVVMCDKNRNGEFPKDVFFDQIGKKCIEEVDGKYIMKKYNISEGIELKQKLHEERINWIKNIGNELTIN